MKLSSRVAVLLIAGVGVLSPSAAVGGRPGEGSIAVVLKSCPDAACAKQAVDEYNEDPVERLELGEGYPRILSSTDTSDIKADVFLVVLGLCHADPRLSGEARDHYPEILTTRLELAPPPGACVTTRKKPPTPQGKSLKSDRRFDVYNDTVYLTEKDKEKEMGLVIPKDVRDRLTISQNGPLIELTAGCGTSCFSSYFLDPGRHRNSHHAIPNPYAIDAAGDLVVRSNGKSLVVEPIFYSGDLAANKARTVWFDRPWAMDADQSIIGCKFLSNERLRIFYYNKQGKKTREIIDLAALKKQPGHHSED